MVKSIDMTAFAPMGGGVNPSVARVSGVSTLVRALNEGILACGKPSVSVEVGTSELDESKNVAKDFLNKSVLRKSCAGKILNKSKRDAKIRKVAFTLAEMMVVMLILSIVMAAFAPVMTRKSKVDMSSPWKWIEGGAGDIRYGVNSSSQMAIIGKAQRTEGSSGRILINTNNNAKNHIIFETSGTNAGVLRTTGNSILFGKLANTDDAQSTGDLGNNSVSIGNSVNSGVDTVAIGKDALFNATDPSKISNSVAIGHSAMYSATNLGGSTLMNNIAIGKEALYSATSASYDVAIGAGALYNDAIGGKNTALGYQALYSESTADRTAVGYQALYEGGNHGSTAVGYQAIYKGTDSNGTAVGYSALYSGGSNSTALGYSALYNGGDSSIAIGVNALDAVNGGTNNIAVGNSALGANTSGSNNIAMGNSALDANTSGGENIAIGQNALGSATNANYNLAIGYYALLNATGSANTAVGWRTMVASSAATGSYNSAFGVYALNANTSGSYNTANGYNSLRGNTIGSYNVAVGTNALYTNGTGSYNTALGYQACSDVTGSNKICIGANSGPASSETIASSTDNAIFIGSTGAKVYIAGVLVDANALVSGSGNYAMFSDSRLKNISGENKAGLEEVKKLKVYNFTFKKDPKKHPHVGVIAQELQKIFPTAVKEGSDGYLTIRWDEMFYAVINAVKELASRIDVYDETFKQIQKDNKALKQEVKQLKEQNKKLEARLEALEAKMK